MKSHLVRILDKSPRIKRPFLGIYHFLISIQSAFQNYLWLNALSARRILKFNLIEHQVILNCSKEECSNKLVLICISRDENVLLDYWVEHHENLSNVCAIVLVDHLSKSPITIDAKKRSKKIDFHLYQFRNNNYLQAHIVNGIAKRIARKYSNAIFFPLDTDEFLTPQVIERICRSELRLGYLNWRTCWPTGVYSHTSSHEPSIFSEKYFCYPVDYLGNKHFMRFSLLERGYQWGQAAHEVYNRFGFPKRGLNFGYIIHIPVRSFKQASSKFNRGASAHQHKLLNGQDSDGNNIFTKHWNIPNELEPNQTKFIENALSNYLPKEATTDNLNQKEWSDLFKDT